MSFLQRINDFNIVAGNIDGEYKPELGWKMLNEELNELNESIVDFDRIEILDALGDIANVALGEMCKQLGSVEKVEEAMNRICESNLSKLYVNKNEYGKVMKGDKYKAPILNDLFDN